MAKKRKVAALETVDSAAAVGKRLGVSERTIHTWMSQGCPGANAQGQYSIDRIRAWRDEHKKPQRQSTEEQRDTTSRVMARKLEADALKAEEDARAKKLKNDMLEGSLLRREEILQAIASEFARVRIRLEQLPDEIEMDFPRKERAAIKLKVERKIELMLHQLADFTLETEDEETIEGDDE